MKRNVSVLLASAAAFPVVQLAFGLSRDLPRPEIFFPKGYDTKAPECGGLPTAATLSL